MRIPKKFISAFIAVTLLLSFVTPAEAQRSKSTEISFNDFGADKSGKHDSGPAIIKAFEFVKERGNKDNVTLIFEPGTYKITKETALVREVHTSNTDSVQYPHKSIGFLIEDQENLSIDGQGSDLIFEGDMMSIGILNSENITVKNLSWDFQVPTTSEMTVFEFSADKKVVDYFVPEYLNYEIVNGNSIRWQSESKSDGSFYWTEMNDHRNYGIQIKYPTEMMGRSYYSNSNPFSGVNKIEKLDNGLLRFTYNNQSPVEPVLGMNYQLVSNAHRPTAGAMVAESKDVYLDNLRISYVHGFGFLVQMSENVFFNQIDMQTDIQTGKNTSSYADGIHVSGAKGKIEITNSFFNNTHDDPINIHGTFTRADKIINPTTVELNYIHKQQGGFTQFFPGDKVIFYSRDTLESSDNEKEYTVKSVKEHVDGNLKKMHVEFEEPVPTYITETVGGQPKYVAENITYTPEILIKNNDFKNVFTRMILVTSRKKVIIEDNNFDAPTMPTLFFSNDSDEWYESGPIRDLEIRNNTFKIRNLGRTWWKYAPAIYFHPVTKGGKFPDANNPIHKNILIEDNTFYLESDGALRAESVENLTFRNNKILRLDPNIELNISATNTMSLNSTQQLTMDASGNEVTGLESLPGGPESNSGSVANVLEFESSKNVLVEGNTYDEGLRKNVLIEKMPEANYTINDDLNILTERKKVAPEKQVGDIHYVSSNPDIATVNAKGLISTHSAGTVGIYAYTVWNDTIIKSNIETLTVSDSSSKDPIELSQYVYEIDQSTKVLNIKDKTGNTLDLANYTTKVADETILTIVNNNVTPLKEGVTKLTIENDNKSVEVYLVVNAGLITVTNPSLNVENQNSRFILAENSFTIERNSGEDLWQADNNLNNLVTISNDITKLDTFSAEVTLDGLPLRQQNSWDSSYFMLMKNNNGLADRDNYISIGKRAHASGIGLVKEENRSNRETNNELGKNLDHVTKMTFIIEKTVNEVKLYYKDATEVLEVAKFDTTFLGNNVMLAIGGWGNTQTNKTLTASKLKLSAGTKDTLNGAPYLDFITTDKNEYAISDLTIENTGSNNYLVTSPESSDLSVIVEDSVSKLSYFSTNNISISEPGTYKIHAFMKANSGKLGKVYTKEMTIKPTVDNNTYVNNFKVDKNITINIPSSIESVLVESNNQRRTESIANLDAITVNGFKVTLNKIESNEVAINEINTNFGTLDISKKNTFISTSSKEETLDVNLDIKGEYSKILAVNEDHNIVYDNSKDTSFSVPIYNGVVSVKVEVFANDGITSEIKTIHVLRNTPIKLNESTVKLNNQILKDNAIIDLERKYTIDDLEINIPDNAKYSLFRSTVNEIDKLIIRIQHEDKLSVEFFEFTITNEKSLVLDKTVLEAKLAELKQITSNFYTIESFTNLQDEILAADVTLNTATTQSELDTAVESLSTAYEALKLDTTNLEEAITKAQKIDKELYTDKSYDTLLEAINGALEAIRSAETPSQLQVALDTLLLAEKNLEIKVVLDKTALKEILAKLKEITSNFYTNESFTKLQDTILAVEKTLTTATTQDEMNSAEAALNTAYEALTLDTTLLQEAIDRAQKIDKELYTESTYNELYIAINGALDAVEFATVPSQLQKALDALILAEKNLEEIVLVLDKSALEDKIQEAQTINREHYTKESIEALEVAIKEAQSILEKATTEIEINEAVQNLQKAIDALEKIDNSLPLTPLEPSEPIDKDKPEINKPDSGDKLPGTGYTDRNTIVIIASSSIALGLYFYLRSRKELKNN